MALEDPHALDVLAALTDADPAATASEIALALRKLLEAAATDRPLVVILEDAESAQPGLLDLIEYLARSSRGRAILVVCVGRPEARAAAGVGRLGDPALEPLAEGAEPLHAERAGRRRGRRQSRAHDRGVAVATRSSPRSCCACSSTTARSVARASVWCPRASSTTWTARAPSRRFFRPGSTTSRRATATSCSRRRHRAGVLEGGARRDRPGPDRGLRGAIRARRREAADRPGVGASGRALVRVRPSADPRRLVRLVAKDGAGRPARAVRPPGRAKRCRARGRRDHRPPPLPRSAPGSISIPPTSRHRRWRRR